MASCVVVRLPSAGTLLGEALRRSGRARVTSVQTSWSEGPDGSWSENLALVEGLTDSDLAHLLLAWNRHYGRPPAVIGESFALRLPVRVDAAPGSGMAELMRVSRRLPALGSVAEGAWAEKWFSCRDDAHAREVAAELRVALRGVPDAEVRVAAPRPHDLHCWEVLQFAAGAPMLQAWPAAQGASMETAG